MVVLQYTTLFCLKADTQSIHHCTVCVIVIVM